MGYRRPVGEGTLSLSFKGTYLLDKVTETTPGIPEGDVVSDGAWENPRFRGNLLMSYKIDDLNIALNTRFISAATYELNTDSDEAYPRSEEHTSELQSLMRISYAVFCLKKNNNISIPHSIQTHINN